MMGIGARSAALLSLILGLALGACGGTAGPASSPASSAPGASAPAAGAAGSQAPSPSASPSGNGLETLDTIQPLPSKVPVRVTMSATAVYPLPIFLAIQQGWFSKANLDVQLTLAKEPGLILPALANNQMDISDMAGVPGLYNQVAQGFDAKLIASLSVPKAGRAPAYFLAVEKDEVDQIKTLQDLAGKTIEALAVGGTSDLMSNVAVQQSGLPAGSVTIAHRAKSPPDLVTIAKNHGADVISAPNVLATSMEQQGFAVKWKSDAEIMPFNATYLAAAGPFMKQQPAALQKFLEIYLLASRQVNASNGSWTPALLQLASEQTGSATDTLTAQGPMLYYDPNGAMPSGGLDKVQAIWLAEGLVKQPAAATSLQDTGPLQAAVQLVGAAN
ncbi:MAG: ABC transporter substrate-binding protein [Chloroflexi bacterium]|nr:ABC transporter substrate-binding protein [Chloroflexota bacterium]